MSFRGTYTVMITPFDQDQQIDLPTLRRFVDWQIENGIRGLVPLGSTGEFLSLTDEERHLVARTVVEQAAGRVPVLIGTGAENTLDVIRYSREAEAMGADGVMIIPPFYSTPTDDELFMHYRRVAESINIPIMLYNNPATANVDMLPPLVARLSEIDNCTMIKESTMDVTRVRDIIRLCGDRLDVFGGIMGFESFLEGAVGWVAVASNVVPREMSQIYDLCENFRDVGKAREIYNQFVPIIRFVGGGGYVAGSKALLRHMGLDVGGPRPPRLPLPPADERLAARLVAELSLSYSPA
ncbi:4-hydroxy-tetrahydrodipicolinate synthase [Komagataeibacter xylinus]|uniref:4-hydroxy-tetrahydrodipicolinate synthase n=1 Tax=Komagataeibacter xylinus TaxID=28448 RepID=A0A318PT47_KOMXY|nr:4-hydroxy-tetrahydrodipicolinate synthase [Komagataeibacter xylinus]PYD56731.1 4-hydroxy-tetrahydrodipicolinate synthase [Komagataeibacter xylinus]GBQ74063.1 dihydrodipicolinate synthase [Komagataeibacter xylinus NBRC 15237]